MNKIGFARRILLTGFGPFPGMAFNASSWLVGELAQTRNTPPGSTLKPVVLPTVWAVAWEVLDAQIEAFRPDLILHFGVSHRARGFCLEQRAFNATTVAGDAAGAAPERRIIRPGGPAIQTATVPLLPVLKALRRHRLAGRLSNDPGRYLCNYIFYRSLARRNDRHSFAGPPVLKGAPRVGFIHIPPVGAETVRSNLMSAEELMRGSAVILQSAGKL